MSIEQLYIFDTTLRDGAQTQVVDFSIDDKIKIAEALDKLGVDYIEGGWPGANPTDTEFFQRNIARDKKDYKLADKIRNELLDKGVLIEDKDDKTSWKLK